MRCLSSFSKPAVCAWVVFLMLCAASAPWGTAQAQLRDQPRPRTDETRTPRAALEKARFDVAKQRAQRLLERRDLDARTRNAALELSAIIDTAARRERAAQATLAELYARSAAPTTCLRSGTGRRDCLPQGHAHPRGGQGGLQCGAAPPARRDAAASTAHLSRRQRRGEHARASLVARTGYGARGGQRGAGAC